MLKKIITFFKRTNWPNFLTGGLSLRLGKASCRPDDFDEPKNTETSVITIMYNKAT